MCHLESPSISEFYFCITSIEIDNVYDNTVSTFTSHFIQLPLFLFCVVCRPHLMRGICNSCLLILRHSLLLPLLFSVSISNICRPHDLDKGISQLLDRL